MFKITISAACGGIHLQPQHLKGQGGQISAAWTTYKFRPAKDTLKDLFQNKKKTITLVVTYHFARYSHFSFKNQVKNHEGWTQWHILVIPTLRRQKRLFKVQGQSELHSEFQASLGYRVKPYLDERKQT